MEVEGVSGTVQPVRCRSSGTLNWYHLQMQSSVCILKYIRTLRNFVTHFRTTKILIFIATAVLQTWYCFFYICLSMTLSFHTLRRPNSLIYRSSLVLLRFEIFHFSFSSPSADWNSKMVVPWAFFTAVLFKSCGCFFTGVGAASLPGHLVSPSPVLGQAVSPTVLPLLHLFRGRLLLPPSFSVTAAWAGCLLKISAILWPAARPIISPTVSLQRKVLS